MSAQRGACASTAPIGTSTCRNSRHTAASSTPDRPHLETGVHCPCCPPGHVDLGGATTGVLRAGADEPGQARLVDHIRIDENQPPDADVRESLDDQRPRSADADHGDRQLVEPPL
nr:MULTISPECIES: hypothetical protein [unclassified Frankia]